MSILGALTSAPWALVVIVWAVISYFFAKKIRMPLPVNKVAKVAMWVLNPAIAAATGAAYLTIFGSIELVRYVAKKRSKTAAAE